MDEVLNYFVFLSYFFLFFHHTLVKKSILYELEYLIFYFFHIYNFSYSILYFFDSIRPKNDIPHIELRRGAMLRLAKGTKKLLPANLLDVKDPDNEPSEIGITLVRTFLSMKVETHFLEIEVYEGSFSGFFYFARSFCFFPDEQTFVPCFMIENYLKVLEKRCG